MGNLDPRLENIFTQAMAIADAKERAAFVTRACGGDETLRQEVEALLQADEFAGDFMKATQVVGPANPLPSEKAGDRIGRYKLLEVIGEGGFGVVWMAEQEEPVRRRVALKIIKLGMDTKEVVARFEAERQALAMMNHPNIAIVFDGGATSTGRPFFVMELVKGIPITDYCDTNRLSTRERLELFMQVCQAVQHAHQKGVIHRDLKPSNILVTVKDDRPVPKVIDFGVAKATQALLTGKTVFTRFHQWIGTPAYMSPEQAGLGSLDVDTRSDVYSLGVLLYELLTGRPPFDTQKLLAGGYDAVMRTIREQEPPKPSTRLSTLAEAELVAVAAKRGSDPAKLNRLVRGDLDWIVMKCLEKDRSRRYDTANGLSLDLKRLLNQEPVLAAPPSAAYRLERFARRNKIALTVACAFITVLLIGIVTSAWQAWRASRFAQQANAQRAIATNESARATAALVDSEKARKQERSTAYANNVALAWREWLNGDEAAVRRVLDDCAPELRAWEWHHLQRLAHSALWTAQASMPDSLDIAGELSGVRIGFTRDDKFLAVFGVSARPTLFDARTGQRLFEWSPKESERSTFTTFSLNGRWLAAGISGTKGVRFIDTRAVERSQDTALIWKELLKPESDWISITSEKDGELQLTGIPVDLFGVRDETWGMGNLMDSDTIREALDNQLDSYDCFVGEWGGQMIMWVARSTRVRELVKAARVAGRPVLHVERAGPAVFLVSRSAGDPDFDLAFPPFRVSNLTEPGADWEPRLPFSVLPGRFHFGVLNKVPHLFVACVSLDRDAGGLFEIPLGESRTPEAIRHPLDDGGIHLSRNVVAMKYVNGPFYGATDMAFDAGDTALVTAGLDRKVRLWAQQPLREIEVIGRHNVAVSAVALGFDRRLVASADRDGRVAVWRRAGAPAAVEVARFTPGKWDGLAGRGAEFDPRHEWITGSVEDGPDQVVVDLVSRASRGGPFGQISSDGKFALLSVSQSTSAIQEIASERQVASFPAHPMQEHLSGNFEWIATVTDFTNIAFANALPGRPSAVRILLDWRPGKGDNRDPLLGINDEGTLLVCRHGAKTASIIRVSHQAGTATTVAVVECSEFIGFLGQDRYAAVIAEGQGCVRVIDTSSGADVAKLPFQDRALSDPTINASRTVLYTLQTQWSKVQQEETPGFSGTQIPFTVHLWSVEHGALSIILRGRPITLDLHPDGRRLACSFYDGAVTMLDTSDGRPLCTFDGYGFVLGFSSDGKRLVTVTHEGRVFLYDGAPIDEKQTSDAIGPSFLENFEETLVAIKARKAARGK